MSSYVEMTRGEKRRMEAKRKEEEFESLKAAIMYFMVMMEERKDIIVMKEKLKIMVEMKKNNIEMELIEKIVGLEIDEIVEYLENL